MKASENSTRRGSRPDTVLQSGDGGAQAAKMADDAVTDFYVVHKQASTAAGLHWLVYRRSLNACVDAAGDARTAIEKAVKLAQFCVLGGKSSQVHLRNSDRAPWRTVWCPPHEQRRYP